MRIHFYGIILLALLFLLAACDEEKGPLESETPFTVEILQLPAQLNLQGNFRYTVYVRVTHPDGPEGIDTVVVHFFAGAPDPILSLPLFDDGEALHPGDGDVAAGDNIYSNRFSPVDPVVFPEGGVSVQVEVVDRNGVVLKSETVVLQALPNPAPVIVSTDAPDTLRSGFDPTAVSVVVQDSVGGIDVTGVQLQVKRNGLVVSEDSLRFAELLGEDSVRYQITLDSSFAAERLGDYILEFVARDKADNLSEPLSKPVFLENSAPRVFNPQLPDTLLRSSGLLLVQVQSDDPQGFTDIDSVYFRSLKPDSTFSGDGFHFVLFDDGSNGDPVAGDGEFSWQITIPATAQLGRYTYFFNARDKVGNLSETVQRSFVLAP